MSAINYSSITTKLETSGVRRVSVNGIPQSRPILVPQCSARQAVFLPTHRTIPAEPINPQMLSGASSMQTITIRRGDINQIDHLMLKITVTVSGGPVVLAQLPLWFNQINLRTSEGNALIATAYSDTLMTNLLIMISSGRMKSLYKTLNIDYTPNGFLGNTNPLAPGTYTFYLPLFSHSVLGNFQGLEMSDSKVDLTFEFFPSNPIVSGTGTIVLSNLAFAVDGSKTEQKDLAIYAAQYANYSSECVFLDPVANTIASKQLNAGTVNLLSLNQLSGLCAFQLVVFRPTGTQYSNANNASWNWLNVGDDSGAALDLVDVNGNQLWGNGSPVSTKFMRNHIGASMCDNAFISTKPVYLMTYCESVLAALGGCVQGAYRFTNSTASLALTLPSAPIQEVQTIQFSTVPTASGNYRFSFRGEVSIDLAATATTIQMAAAIGAMKVFASQFITVVPSTSAYFNSNNGFTLTFTTPASSGLEGDLISVISDGLGCVSTTFRTTAGTSGLSSGLYDITIYSYLYRSGSYINGRLRSDLIN